MKTYIVFSVCFVAFLLVAGQSMDGYQILKTTQGGGECDAKKLEPVVCSSRVPGCTSQNFDQCMSCSPGERKKICNKSQGKIACKHVNPNSDCQGTNQDELSDEKCETPKTAVEPL